MPPALGSSGAAGGLATATAIGLLRRLREGRPSALGTANPLIALFLAIGCLTPGVAPGQILPPPSRFGEPGPEATRPALPEFRPEPEPEFELPPLPPLVEEPPLATAAQVFVNAIRLAGNTVFSTEELAPVVAPYVGRTVTIEDLLDLRDALSHYYAERGYVTSGAVIPDQEVRDGVIEVQIIEGQLTEIEVAGLRSLRPEFVENRIRLGAGPPLNVDDLREQVQLLLLDPAVEQVNARVGPGLRPGEGRLEIDVIEAPPYQVGLRFANDRSPSVGAERGELTLVVGNILGCSDPLRLQLGLTRGLREGSIDYSVPLTARDLRLFIGGEITEADVVEEPFRAIDVESESQSIQLGVSWPVIRTLDDEVRLDARLQRKRSTTFLLGRRFSFSEGVQDGRSDITALRLAQQWQRRAPDQVIALRFTESLGIDVFGATRNPSGVPDGQFFTWLGQGQFARRLFGTDWQINFRGDVQLSANPLLPIERIAIGGMDTVRGYRENQLVVDNGWIVSAELRVPLGRLAIPYLSPAPDDGAVQLVPFVDAGGGWNQGTPTPDDNRLYSVGAGLRWTPNPRIALRFDVGVPLVGVPEPEDRDLQDLGIHFELAVRL